MLKELTCLFKYSYVILFTYNYYKKSSLKSDYYQNVEPLYILIITYLKNICIIRSRILIFLTNEHINK